MSGPPKKDEVPPLTPGAPSGTSSPAAPSNPKKPKKKAKKKPKKSKAPPRVQTPTVVPSPNDILTQVLGISTDEIHNLDLPSLRDKMTKSIYLLEGVLFSQASFEFARITRNRELLTILETDLFDQKKFNQLSTNQKMSLFHSVSSSMNVSLKYLMELHGNVASGLDVVSQIEKLKLGKTSGASPAHVKDPVVDQVRSRIKDMIRSRVTNNPDPKKDK